VIRRLTIALCALLGAASLTACSTFERNDVAASVNGVELSQDDLQLILESELGADILKEAPVDGSISGASARSVLGAWAALGAIEQAGLTADVDVATIQADLAEQFGTKWTDAPPVMQDLATANVAVGTKVQAGTLSQEDVLAAFAAADVFIDSRYGSWDPTSGRVRPLG
jgi:hypothetical protein